MFSSDTVMMTLSSSPSNLKMPVYRSVTCVPADIERLCEGVRRDVHLRHLDFVNFLPVHVEFADSGMIALYPGKPIAV